MKKPKIIVVGIGPGGQEDITPAVKEALSLSDVVIGYQYYFRFVQPLLKADAVTIDTGMRRERERAQLAFEQAMAGHVVCVISSGDAGIYGMAPLVLEMKQEMKSDVEIEVLPGISAFQKAASLLGAPIGHDFCVISMSDLMTPWEKIEARIRAAAMADFVTAVYNPKSKNRYWQLYRLKELFLLHRSPATPVGYVKQAGREEQIIKTTTLEQFDPEEVDMFTVVLIGNSQSFVATDGTFITPRGYYREKGLQAKNKGQEIMMSSFAQIAKEMKRPHIDLDKKWALLHAIHTTADFAMEELFYADPGAVAALHRAIKEQRLTTIVTDVSMVASGIRKKALERLGVQVLCYLNHNTVAENAAQRGTTRSQEAIKLAVEEHPDALYVFGNAPTALMELCKQIRLGHAQPAGIIAAPVGFVNVQESKHMVKPFTAIPKLIIEGRRGGSNLAATLVNAILTYDDASQLKPGRDV